MSLTTSLFTDIVDSTARVASLGDRAWAELLERHHRIVRAQLQRFAGQEMDEAGDGFFAMFADPAAAIRCAASIVDALREIGLEVRAGVHVGDCHVVGSKCTGLAIHIGARLAALARPGDVLVSEAVVVEVPGSAGIVFEDRGVHELRGVPGELRVLAAGLA